MDGEKKFIRDDLTNCPTLSHWNQAGKGSGDKTERNALPPFRGTRPGRGET